MQAVLTRQGFDETTQQALRAASLTDQQLKEVSAYSGSRLPCYSLCQNVELHMHRR